MEDLFVVMSSALKGPCFKFNLFRNPPTTATEMLSGLFVSAAIEASEDETWLAYVTQSTR